MKKNTTHNLTVAAMLSAVAFILMFIEFPIPMLIPSFVKMDFSDLPALLRAEKVLKKLQANELVYQALLADDPALPLLREVDALRGQSLCAEESVHLALKRLIEAVEKQEK